MPHDQQPPSLLEELDAIAAVARQALLDLDAGNAINGVSALQRIRNRAQDAARHVRENLEAGSVA